MSSFWQFFYIQLAIFQRVSLQPMTTDNQSSLTFLQVMFWYPCRLSEQLRPSGSVRVVSSATPAGNPVDILRDIADHCSHPLTGRGLSRVPKLMGRGRGGLGKVKLYRSVRRRWGWKRWRSYDVDERMWKSC